MLSQSTGTRLIPLSQGLWTLVDAADYPALNAYKWSAERKRGGAFYATRCIDPHKETQRMQPMHRLIIGAPKGVEVDHINRDGLDNRRCNLRIATRTQNVCNRGMPSNNASGFKGVSWYRRDSNWEAYIAIHRLRRFLGRYETPEEAARVYDDAARELHGEFAVLNFPCPEEQTSHSRSE